MYDPAGKTFVRKDMIVQGLRELGLQEGDLVHVHSSLSSLGYVEGGADTVVDALLEVVGPAGTVMVPTFNHGQADVYDVKTTPSINGAITEALRKRPEAKRSMHPTHPYAAIGPLAEELTRGHLEVDTFDRASPLGKLGLMGGWVLLLGVDMRVCTAAHIGETMARVPCLGYGLFPRKIIAADGSIQPATSVIWRKGSCLIEWEPLERILRQHQLITNGKIGDAKVMLMKAEDVIQTAYRLALVLCPLCRTGPGPLEGTT